MRVVVVALVLTTLASCTERELRRAGVGAGVGAAGAIILDGNPIKGAVIGGATSVLLDNL